MQLTFFKCSAFTAALLLFSASGIDCSGPDAGDDRSVIEQAPADNADRIETISQGNLPVPRAAVDQWVQRAATAVSLFYGHFPVKRVTIHVLPADSGQVRDGVETDGNQISIRLGQDTKSADLRDDWMLTHEMFHLSQPDLDERYSWMSEGMADYLEPVARVRIGQISAEHFWKDLVEGLPQGLPESGDQGLDHTHTWARTYWGGSLFWLLADLHIRQITHNAKSVRDAARAVLDGGGDGSQSWSIERLIETYDHGTGTHVFQILHNEMGDKPIDTDLNSIWKSLGVIYRHGKISFDNAAPLADVRRGITSK